MKPTVDNNTTLRSPGAKPYLSPVAVWALAFGCSVGWGCFVMPGTTFLPIAGPLGSVIGLLVGAFIMMMFGMSYQYLMKRCSDPGGVYSYAKTILGSDHGFLCAWILIITYTAIIWANSTALSLLVRFVFGDIFCFGFSYEIAGYTVYLGEVLLSIAALALTCAVCVVSKRLSAWVQTISAIALFGGITVCFIAVLLHNGGLPAIKPLFSGAGDPSVQIFGIVILAPWAFIGFESISHSTSEFRFSVRKTPVIMAAALLTGALSYGMLTVCASLSAPDGFSSWTEYIAALSSLDGITGLPTFNAARAAMGDAGLLVLFIAAVGGVVTGLIANYIALSRLFYSLSHDTPLHVSMGKVNRQGIPYVALIVIASVSAIMPFFGRTAIGWIVDVTTIGASIVYAYTSACAFTVGRREKLIKVQIVGAVGFVIALGFSIVYLFPIVSRTALATESYMILILWSLIGMVMFSILIRRDTTRAHGKSVVVWMSLMLLILLVSHIWVTQKIASEAADVVLDVGSSVGAQDVSSRVYEYSSLVTRNMIIHTTLVIASLIVIFSIFSTFRKRESYIEAERILAEKNSRAKSTFLSNMSHDIRTPMNAVTGYTALALREEGISDKLRSYLNNIDTSSRYMLSIINDILDMSRIESGKMELDLVPADLVAVIDEIESIFRHQMEAKQLAFTSDSSGISDRYVVCDKNRLYRIIMNLVSNAFKFTPDGGSISLVMKQTGSGGGSADYVLSVKDNGIGMSPEFAEKIFEAFERERTTTVSGIQGTGLGMSITKRFVEMMGGSIEVITEKDKGTEFVITLSFPIADDDQIRSLKPDDDDSASRRALEGKRVLLVEDNPINSEIATMMLTHEGLVVDAAGDGRQAVDKVADAPDDAYDIILMDIQMQVMNGYEAAEAIRALPSPKGDIPIIAMTANTSSEDIQAARDAGMQGHVAKPIEVDKMIDTLIKILSERTVRSNDQRS